MPSKELPPPPLSGAALEEAVAEKRKLEKDYNEEVLAKGILILERSGAAGSLDELAEIINSQPGKQDATRVNIHSSFPSDRKRDLEYPEHPREQVRFMMGIDGTVSTGIGWNYDDDLEKDHHRATHNGIIVAAQPLTGAIVVKGKISAEFIPQSTWEKPGGIGVVENAIARAYKRPSKMYRPATA